MGIIFHEETKTFHLTNGEISYIMTVLPNGHLGNLYYGKAIRDREDFSHLLELVQRPMFQYVYDDDRLFSLGVSEAGASCVRNHRLQSTDG